MTRRWAGRVAVISLVFFIVLGAGELLFAWAVYEFAGGITDFSYAMHDVEVNERPGPWNNGHPLSKERATELRMHYLDEYREDLWRRSYVIIITLVLLLAAILYSSLVLVRRPRKGEQAF